MPISVIQKQLDSFEKDIIEYSIKNKKRLTLYDLNIYKQEIFKTLQNFQSLFQAIHLPSKTNVNVFKTHKRNIDDIRREFGILNETITDLYELIDVIKEISKVNDTYKQNIIAQLTTSADNIRANINNTEYIYTIDFSTNDIIDTEVTTAFIDNENRQCKSKEMSVKDILSFGSYTDDLITVSYQGKHIVSKSEQGGRISDTLKGGQYNDYSEFFIEQSARTNCSVIIDIPVASDRSERYINNVSMETLSYYTEFSAQFYASKNGADYIPISDPIPNSNNKFNIHFKNDKYKYVRINLSKSIEDTRDGSRYNYQFGIRKISIKTSGFSTASSLVTTGFTKFNSDGDIVIPRMVSLEVDDYVPNGTEIRYFVKRKQDVDWKSITPTNKAKAANNIIEFGKTKQYIIDDISPSEPSSHWSDITPFNNFGNVALYNILAKVNDSPNPNTHNPLVDSAVDSKTYQGLITGEGEFIEMGSVELKRGKGDYSIDTNALEIPGKVEKIRYSFKYSNIASAYDYVDMYIRLINTPYKISENGEVDLSKYSIVNPEFINIVYDGKQVLDFNYNINTGVISFTSYKVSDVVYISFNATIQSIEAAQNVEIEIDNKSFVFINTLDKLELDAGNFELDIPNRKISLSVNTDLTQSTLGDIQVDVSFNYVSRRTSNGKYYRTFIENKEETTIYVIPFNSKEIQFGNFHFIDGDNVSSLKKVVISPGKHVIETTQPYPTNPSDGDDNNLYTLEYSEAGIILPTNVIQYALELPQRRVSLFNLSNTVNINDHRSFAVEDNKIWLNKIPDHLQQHVLNNSSTSSIRGKELLGKKVTYVNGKFYTYVSIPEAFTLIYNTYQKEETGVVDNEVQIKANLVLKEGNTEITPVINRVSVRFL